MRRVTTTKPSSLKAFLLIIAVIGLAACGQKGPLVLQNKNTPSNVNAEKTPEANSAHDINKK